MRSLSRSIKRRISKHGWYFSYADGVGYTVGLRALNHPDLIVVGMKEETCYRLLTLVVQWISAGLHLTYDTQLQLGQGLYFNSCPSIYLLWKDRLMPQCYLYYHEEFEARQLYRNHELLLSRETYVPTSKYITNSLCYPGSPRG
jgi:Domain of unknown function (DUF4262)